MLCKCEERGAGTNMYSIGPQWRADHLLRVAMWWSVLLSTGMTLASPLWNCMTWRQEIHAQSITSHGLTLVFHRIHWRFSSSCWMYVDLVWCNQRVILHCNARIGRSGVFCLTDVCMSWMKGGVCTHWILSVFSFTWVSRDWTDSDPWTATIRLLNCPECSSLCIGAGSENSWSAERCGILHKTLREADAKCPHAV